MRNSGMRLRPASYDVVDGQLARRLNSTQPGSRPFARVSHCRSRSGEASSRRRRARTTYACMACAPWRWQRCRNTGPNAREVRLRPRFRLSPGAPIWPWLLGPFITAWLRSFRRPRTSPLPARAIPGAPSEAGLGTISGDFRWRRAPHPARLHRASLERSGNSPSLSGKISTSIAQPVNRLAVSHEFMQCGAALVRQAP